MIKCMLMLRRKPELSREEFAAYWSGTHARLAIETAPAMGMVRYVQNHAVDHPMAKAFEDARGCQVADFDGVAEAWWPDFETMAKTAGTMPEEVAKAVVADENRFIDMPRSVIFFAEEKPFWPA